MAEETQGLSLVMKIVLILALAALIIIFRDNLMSWAKSLLVSIFG